MVDNICPECGDRLIFYRRGSSQGCNCRNPRCEYGFTTTYIPDIQLDETVYHLYITSLGDNWKQALVFLSRQFNLGINAARKFKIPGQLLISTDAAEIFKVRKMLSEKGISVAIAPEYKYDVWDDKPQGNLSWIDNSVDAEMRDR